MSKKTELLERDDELTREAGFTDGPKKVAKLNLRPVTGLSLSWMQRHRIFDDESDMIQKTSAFAFLHSVDRDIIRSVIHDRGEFLNAVDDWIDENISHHDQLNPVAAAMNESLNQYMTSMTMALNPSEAGSRSKN